MSPPQSRRMPRTANRVKKSGTNRSLIFYCVSKNSYLEFQAPSLRELSPPQAVTEGVKQHKFITFPVKNSLRHGFAVPPPS